MNNKKQFEASILQYLFYHFYIVAKQNTVRLAVIKQATVSVLVLSTWGFRFLSATRTNFRIWRLVELYLN
jgi:hypothetical protein